FGHQYAQEMRLASGQRSTEWVKRLPAIVAALNDEATRLTGKRPSEVIRARSLLRSTQKPSLIVPGRLVGLEEAKLPSGVGVRYLYRPGELERGAGERLIQYGPLGRAVTKPDESVVYYLQDGPQRGLCARNFLLCHRTLSFLRMEF
ncbi:MAG: hypothetical protein AB2556_25510, partial [Candidatus Thiodiazotropha sp.]